MAIVRFVERNGPATPLNETQNPLNLNFGSADQSGLTPTASPLTAQADGHSFEKWVQLRVIDFEGSTIIDNCKIWLSDVGGGFKEGEGITTNARLVGYSSVLYPINGPVQTASPIAIQDILIEEPPSANIGIGGSLTGQITPDTTVQDTDYIVLQLNISESTPGGSLNQKTITFQYDEQ